MMLLYCSKITKNIVMLALDIYLLTVCRPFAPVQSSQSLDGRWLYNEPHEPP